MERSCTAAASIEIPSERSAVAATVGGSGGGARAHPPSISDGIIASAHLRTVHTAIIGV